MKKSLTHWTQFSKKIVKKSLEYAIIDIGISRLFPTRKGAKQGRRKDEITETAFCVRERAKEKTGDMLINILILLAKCNLSTLGS